jgi:hypothetical protein
MYLCYIDESGTPDVPGNTSHYILAGIAVPVWNWKNCDNEIDLVKRRFGLSGDEIHVAWLLRTYLEQSRIANFAALDYQQRRAAVESRRTAELLRLQRANNPKQYQQTRKNYQKTERYIHLTLTERRQLVQDIALCVSKWGYARIFAECIDKVHFNPIRMGRTIDEQSLEQIVSRFQQFLQNIAKINPQQAYGLLIHDNNETVAKKHTSLMKNYHQSGTLWTEINNIIETPLFVDSQLTGMVQIADLCAYALRRYLENNEEELFDLIFQRADRKDGVVVSVRHFTKPNCTCKICIARKR